MPAERKRLWMIVGVLALVSAAALALTAPRDNTRFVSARRPGHARREGSAARAGPRQPAGPDPAHTTDTPRASHGPGPSGRPDPTDPARLPQAPTRNLFRPLVSRARPSGALPPAYLPPLSGDMAGLLPLPIPGVNGAAGARQRAYWQYVGTVQVDRVTYALIEEKKTKAGVYLKEGDVFRGGLVRAVRPGYVVIAMAGRRYALPKATGMEEQPANGTAAPANAPAQGQPAAPGAQTPGGPPAQPGSAQPDSRQAPEAAVMPQEGPPAGDGAWGGRRRGRRRGSYGDVQ